MERSKKFGCVSYTDLYLSYIYWVQGPTAIYNVRHNYITFLENFRNFRFPTGIYNVIYAGWRVHMRRFLTLHTFEIMVKHFRKTLEFNKK